MFNYFDIGDTVAVCPEFSDNFLYGFIVDVTKINMPNAIRHLESDFVTCAIDINNESIRKRNVHYKCLVICRMVLIEKALARLKPDMYSHHTNPCVEITLL